MGCGASAAPKGDSILNAIMANPQATIADLEKAILEQSASPAVMDTAKTKLAEWKEAKRIEDEAEAERKKAAEAKSGAEAAKKAQKAVADRMKEGLENVKENCTKSIEDPEMMTKILDVVGQFQQSTLQDENCKKTFKNALCGYKMRKDTVKKDFCVAFQGLTGSSRLAKTEDLDTNIFGFKYLLDRMNKVVEKLDEDKENGEDEEEVDEAEMDGADKRRLEQKRMMYEQDRLEMLEFLTGCYDLAKAMPNNWRTKAKIEDKEFTSITGKIGAAAFAIKVYDFAKIGKELKRVAFVGPESVGKSTVINSLTSGGRGDPFMATSEGMGTQICCLISDAPQEKLYLMTSQGQESLGHGEALSANMAKVNEAMKKKKKKVGDISAFRATKPWNPPFDIELVDVPGIKDATRFESVLALSMCSTICICLGDLKQATKQLENGSLKLLRDVVEEIEDDICLMCLITRDVSLKDYSPKAYQDLLKTSFPKARGGIKVIYANFRALEGDDTRKAQVVDNFFKVVDKHPAKEIEPHRKFKSLADDMETYLGKCTQAVHSEMDDYFNGLSGEGEFDCCLREKVSKKLNELKIDNESVRQIMKKSPIGKTFQIAPKTFPVFSVGIANMAAGEVSDEVLVAQEMLFECRIAIIQWLRNQGENLHMLSFANNFDGMCEMIFTIEDDVTKKEDKMDPDGKTVKRRARQIVCDAFCGSTDGGESNPESKPDKRKWWEDKYSHKVGPFLKFDSFPWIIIGYYLIRSEQNNKRAIFDHFLLNEETKEVDWAVEQSQAILKDLEELPQSYLAEKEGWVPRCNEKMAGSTSRQPVFQEIFNCMESACRLFEDMVNRHGLCHAGKPLEQLFEVSFVMLQRLCVTKPFDGDIKFTGFARHLKQSVKSLVELKKIAKSLKDVSPDSVTSMCQEALDLMRQAGSDKIGKWKRTTEDMEDVVSQLAILSAQMSTGFNEGGSEKAITIITPRVDSDGGENDVPESTSSATIMETTETIEGWQQAAGKRYEDCPAKLSELLTKWRVKEMRDMGYYKTDRGGNYIELTEEQAQQEREKNNRYAFSVNMKDFLQTTLSNGRTRQLKPVGTTERAIKKSASGAIGQPIGTSPEPTDEGEEDFPKFLQQVNGQLQSTYQPHNPPSRCSGDMAYAKSAIKEIRKGGSKVVVYYRRTDDYSTDPIGIDLDILGELAMEPHVGCCIVVWCEPDHMTGKSWDGEYLKTWQKHAGEVKIRLFMASEIKKGSINLVDEVEKELSDGQSHVDWRLEKKRKDIKEKATKFTDKVMEFLKVRTDNENHSAIDFQQHLRDNIREKADERKATVGESLSSGENSIEFKIPTGDGLFGMAEFMSGSTDRVEGENAASINELKCRAFLSNILLGQVLAHAELVARRLYDQAFMKVLDAVGDWFCMDGTSFLEELDNYVNAKQEKGDEDKSPEEVSGDNKIALIRDFINRDHFVQMFAGCTLCDIMPLLYSLVLPTLWDRAGGPQKKGGVSADRYEEHRKKAIDMLNGALAVYGDGTATGVGAK